MPSIKSAGLVDYVQHAQPIDMTKARESDDAAAEEVKKAAEAAKKAV